MKTYGGNGGIAPQFLTLALDGDKWPISGPSHFTVETGHRTHWIGR
jgi:hypothetical protein